jgi:hypothetical protein
MYIPETETETASATKRKLLLQAIEIHTRTYVVGNWSF